MLGVNSEINDDNCVVSRFCPALNSVWLENKVMTIAEVSALSLNIKDNYDIWDLTSLENYKDGISLIFSPIIRGLFLTEVSI